MADRRLLVFASLFLSSVGLDGQTPPGLSIPPATAALTAEPDAGSPAGRRIALGDQAAADGHTAEAVGHFVAALGFSLVAFVLLPDGKQSTLIAVGAATVLAAITLAARRGRRRLAGGAIVAVLWLIATVDLVFGGGVSAPGQSVYLVAILMAAFVIDLRAAVITTAMSIAVADYIVNNNMAFLFASCQSAGRASSAT